MTAASPRFPSLQRRVLALVLGAVALVWLASGLFTWFDARHELDELLDGHLAQAAALLVAQQVRAVGETEDDDEEHRRIDAPSLHRYAPRVTFQVWHEGRLALRSSNAPTTAMAPPGKRFEPGFHTVALGDARWRVFAAEGAEHDVQVYVGERIEARLSILRAVLRSTLWPVAAALPLLALAIWWAVRHGLRPLRQLGRALAARDPRTLEPLAIRGAPAEMRPALDALNALFGRIGELIESERRFTADAAHELRTPLAAIRTQAQVALGEADAEARQHALRATLEGCDRAARLIEQLLMLSRLEATEGLALQPVELAALVRQVCAALAPAAQQQMQQVALDAPLPCTVAGDEALLAVLVRNLLDNAIRYSPRAARIELRLRRDGEGVTLDVEDSGPGMAEADIARIGQRFFRVLGHDAPGSGLGWSIVQRIAATHGATLQVGRSARLGGLSVRLRLPAAGTASAADRRPDDADLVDRPT